jgi:hypothetical protein
MQLINPLKRMRETITSLSKATILLWVLGLINGVNSGRWEMRSSPFEDTYIDYQVNITMTDDCARRSLPPLVIMKSHLTHVLFFYLMSNPYRVDFFKIMLRLRRIPLPPVHQVQEMVQSLI